MSDSLVTTVGAKPPPGWQDLALAEGGFYHDLRWIQLIGSYFRFPVSYLSVADSIGLAGVLALAEVPSLGWGRRLVSFPFSYAAGPASRVETATLAIMEAAATLGRERRTRRVEVKHWTAPATAYAGFNRVRHYAAYRVATTDGVEALWQRLHADSTRRSIRRASEASDGLPRMSRSMKTMVSAPSTRPARQRRATSVAFSIARRSAATGGGSPGTSVSWILGGLTLKS